MSKRAEARMRMNPQGGLLERETNRDFPEVQKGKQPSMDTRHHGHVMLEVLWRNCRLFHTNILSTSRCHKNKTSPWTMTSVDACPHPTAPTAAECILRVLGLCNNPHITAHAAEPPPSGGSGTLSTSASCTLDQNAKCARTTLHT